MVLAQNSPHSAPQAQRQGPDKGSTTQHHWVIQPRPDPSLVHSFLPSLCHTWPLAQHTVLGLPLPCPPALNFPFQNSKLYVYFTAISKSHLSCEAWPPATPSWALSLCPLTIFSHTMCSVDSIYFCFSPVSRRETPWGQALSPASGTQLPSKYLLKAIPFYPTKVSFFSGSSILSNALEGSYQSPTKTRP